MPRISAWRRWPEGRCPKAGSDRDCNPGRCWQAEARGCLSLTAGNYPQAKCIAIRNAQRRHSQRPLNRGASAKMPQFISYSAAAQRLTALGRPTTRRAVESWARRFPNLKYKISGRAGLYADAFDLIVAGVPLGLVAKKLRDFAAEARSPAENGGETRDAA